MYARDLAHQASGEGLNLMEAQFITEHLSIDAVVSSPETRISDYLNGSARSVEIQPKNVKMSAGSVQDLSQTMAHLTKAQIMFVIPILEPDGPERDAAAWAWYLKYRCWAAVGRHSLQGDVHAENYRDPRLLLRALEQRQFLPFTNAQLSHPDGSVTEHSTVIVNRWHLEMLSVPKPRW